MPRASCRYHLNRDLKKHRRWLAIDSVLMVVFGVVLFAVPGPNIVGYYFAFRVVGHFLSYRGATPGLNAVSWTYEPSAPLTELRRLLTLDPGLREPRVHAVAGDARGWSTWSASSSEARCRREAARHCRPALLCFRGGRRHRDHPCRRARRCGGRRPDLLLQPQVRWKGCGRRRRRPSLPRPAVTDAPCAVLRADDPYLTFARAVALFADEWRPPAGVHRLAYVEPGATIAPDASIRRRSRRWPRARGSVRAPSCTRT